MNKIFTERGFGRYEFKDKYGETCSIQKTSLDEDTIWLGVDVPTPKIMVSNLREDLTGWINFPLPENVVLYGRMHLTQDMVKELLPILQKFADTGEI